MARGNVHMGHYQGCTGRAPAGRAPTVINACACGASLTTHPGRLASAAFTHHRTLWRPDIIILAALGNLGGAHACCRARVSGPRPSCVCRADALLLPHADVPDALALPYQGCKRFQDHSGVHSSGIRWVLTADLSDRGYRHPCTALTASARLGLTERRGKKTAGPSSRGLMSRAQNHVVDT